jgi:lysophospholipase L1-like esterase
VRDAAASSHISFVDVTTPGTYSEQDFSDGFHMNERGAARYTRMLSAALSNVLQDGDAYMR